MAAIKPSGAVVDSEEGPLDGAGRGVVAAVVRDVLGQGVVAGVKIQVLYNLSDKSLMVNK